MQCFSLPALYALLSCSKLTDAMTTDHYCRQYVARLQRAQCTICAKPHCAIKNVTIMMHTLSLAKLPQLFFCSIQLSLADGRLDALILHASLWLLLQAEER